MRTAPPILALLLLCIPLAPRLHAQSASTPIFNLPTSTNVAATNWVAVLKRPNVTNGTEKATLQQIIDLVTVGAGGVTPEQLLYVSNQVQTVSNSLTSYTLTASNNSYTLETTRHAAVSNALVTLSSNNVRVIAGTGGITVTSSGSGGVQTFTVSDDDAGGGGGGDVTQAQLTTASNALVTFTMTASNDVYTTETTRNAAVSNALVTLLTANDTTTSNGLFSVETTRNAAVSNALVTLLVANDTTTSNGLFSVETTRNAAVSNALVTLLVANDTTTSNGLFSVETTRNAAVSNALVTLLVANDTTTSNGAVAFTMTASNNLYSTETTRNAAVSNGAVAFAMAASNDVYSTETTRNAAVSNSLVTLSSNNVRVVGGSGGITVTSSGSGGVQTFTVNDDDAGGGSTTNFVVSTHNYSAHGSLLITNSLAYILQTPVLRGTNLWIDGGSNALFEARLASTAGGLTNFLWTNLVDNSETLLWVWATNGVTVGFPQFVAADFPDGAVVTPATNGWSRVRVSRRGSVTNIQVTTPGLELSPGASLVFSTNPATRVITADVAGPVTNGIRTDVLNLQGATNGLNTRMANAEGATNGLTTRATNLEGATNGLRTDVLNLQGATNGLATRLANAEGATNGLTTRATNLEGATNGLRTDVLNLQGATNGLATRLANAEGATNGLATRVNNLDGATNGLTSRVTAITNTFRTDVSNLQGATNGLTTRATNLEGATNGLDSLVRTKQHGTAILTNLSGTGAITNQSVVYVSPSGSDANPGTFASPVLTGNRALELIRGNGTVIMKEGFHATKFNRELMTNVWIRADGTAGLGVTNMLGSNVTSFSSVGSGVYSFTYASNAWVTLGTNDSPFIYELGTPWFLLPGGAARSPLRGHQRYALDTIFPLRNVAHLAALTNGSFTVSNNTIFLKFSDGAAPGVRTVQLPERYETNSFIYGTGTDGGTLRISGITSMFGYTGFSGSYLRSATFEGCRAIGNYDAGFVNHTMNGPFQLSGIVSIANNNDGVGTTWSKSTTNIFQTTADGFWIFGNGDEGWSDHGGALSVIRNGVTEHNTGGGVTTYGGARTECISIRSYRNDYGFVVAGNPFVYDTTWTNLYTHIVMRDCWTDDCRIGVGHDFASDNLKIEAFNSWIGANLPFGYTPVASDGTHTNCILQLTDCSVENYNYIGGGAAGFYKPVEIFGLLTVGAGTSNTVTIGNTNVVIDTVRFGTGHITSGMATNSFLYLNASTNLAAGSVGNGLAISGGTLAIPPGTVSNLIASSINVTPGNVLSNVGGIKGLIWTNYVQTASNFVFSFNTNYVELKNQTNVVFTNIVEEATAVRGNIEVHIHNTTGVTMGLVWPAYGAQHGYFFQTNANNPILTTTTLASGAHGIASISAFGTNLFASFTTWP